MSDDGRETGWDTPSDELGAVHPPQPAKMDASMNLRGPVRCKRKHTEHLFDKLLRMWMGKREDKSENYVLTSCGGATL